MNKTIRLLFILIITAIISLILYFSNSNLIKVTDTFNYNNFSSRLKEVINKFELQINDLYVIDLNTDGFTIFIDKDNQEVLRTTLELIKVNKFSKDNSKTIYIEYDNYNSTFHKIEGPESEFNNSLQANRIAIGDYLIFLSSLDIKLVLSDYENSDTDYYEITTDGLYRKIQLSDLNKNYKYYKYEDGNIITLDKGDSEKFQEDKYYLPVLLSIGEIYNKEDVEIYDNNLSVIILIEIW